MRYFQVLNFLIILVTSQYILCSSREGSNREPIPYEALTGLEKYFITQIKEKIWDEQVKEEIDSLAKIERKIERIRAFRELRNNLLSFGKTPQWSNDLVCAYRLNSTQFEFLKKLQASNFKYYTELKILQLLEWGLHLDPQVRAHLIKNSQRSPTPEVALAPPAPKVEAIYPHRSPVYRSARESERFFPYPSEGYEDDSSQSEDETIELEEEYYEIEEDADFLPTPERLEEELKSFNLRSIEVFMIREIQRLAPTFTNKCIGEFLKKSFQNGSYHIQPLYETLVYGSSKKAPTSREFLRDYYQITDEAFSLLAELHSLDPEKYKERRIFQLLDEKSHKDCDILRALIRFEKELHENESFFREKSQDIYTLFADVFQLTTIDYYYLQELKKLKPTKYTEATIRALLEGGIHNSPGDLIRLYDKEMTSSDSRSSDFFSDENSLEGSSTGEDSSVDSGVERKGDVKFEKKKKRKLFRELSQFVLNASDFESEMLPEGSLAKVRALESTPARIFSYRDVLDALKGDGSEEALKLVKALQFDLDSSHPRNDLNVCQEALNQARYGLEKILNKDPSFFRKYMRLPLHKKWGVHLFPEQVHMISALQEWHFEQFSDECIQNALNQGEHLNGGLEEVFISVLQAAMLAE